MPEKRIVTIRQTRRWHRVSHECDGARTSRPPDEAQRGRMQMDSVGNHFHRCSIVREQCAGRSRRAMLECRHGVEQMRAMPSSSIQRGDGRLIRSRGMPDARRDLVLE